MKRIEGLSLGFIGIHAGRRKTQPVSQNETLANLFERDGFVFDTGPSLVTLPAVYRDLFLKTGGALEESIDLLDPTSEISRFEDKIRREEAKVLGQQEIAASTLDAQFESLDDLDKQAEVDARLAALKAGSAPKAVTS